MTGRFTVKLPKFRLFIWLFLHLTQDEAIQLLVDEEISVGDAEDSGQVVNEKEYMTILRGSQAIIHDCINWVHKQDHKAIRGILCQIFRRFLKRFMHFLLPLKRRFI